MFLDFIYSDNIHTPLVPGSNDVVELLLVADEYEMPRLRSICEAGMATGEVDMEYRTGVVAAPSMHGGLYTT